MGSVLWRDRCHRALRSELTAIVAHSVVRDVEGIGKALDMELDAMADTGKVRLGRDSGAAEPSPDCGLSERAPALSEAHRYAARRYP